MNVKHLVFLLLCITIDLSKTQQFTSQSFRTDHAKIPMRLDEFILSSLSLLQQKLTRDTFTNEDMHALGLLMDYIHKKKEKLDKRKMKEQTVYWLLRQGR